MPNPCNNLADIVVGSTTFFATSTLEVPPVLLANCDDKRWWHQRNITRSGKLVL